MANVRHMSGLDPVAFEVIKHKLWSINQEGSETMVHVSGSPVVHGNDYSFGIFTPTGEMAVVGVHILQQSYCAHLSLKVIIERYDDIDDGDVFVLNDPYKGSGHQNDVQFFMPVFHHGELIAWLACMAHQVDLGGLDPGSWSPFATDVYQEGLRIPAARIVRRDTVNQELWDVVMTNTRVPFTVANDFAAFLAGLRIARKRLLELCDRYGAELVQATMQQAIETSERSFREELRNLPDGSVYHESYLDRPVSRSGEQVELIKVKCRLEKRGDQLIFDFNGSDPQSNAYGMSTWPGTLGAVTGLIFLVFGVDIPWNHGLMRPLEFVADSGLCVSATEPTPVSGGSAAASWVAMCAAMGCLAKLLSFDPELAKHVSGPGIGSWQLAQFGGTSQYGEPFANMYLDSMLWGESAYAFRDGVDSGVTVLVPAGGAEDVEQQEISSPLLYLWRREVPDSGGAGRMRGGNGIEYALTPIDTDEISVVLATHGVELPLRTGLFGAYPGACARYGLVEGSELQQRWADGQAVSAVTEVGGSARELPGLTAGLILHPGDIVTIGVHNGGGYGDPILRNPEKVADEVADGVLTEAWAQRTYGVVLSDGAVDESATAAFRERIRDERRARMQSPSKTEDTTHPADVPPPAADWGESLRFARDASGTTVACCTHCDAELGSPEHGWRSLAGTIDLDPREAGPQIKVHRDLVLRQYVCPNCATSLWVDLIPVDGRPASDFTLG